MAAPNRMKQIEKEWGEPGVQLVLRLLNEHKTLRKVGDIIGMSESSLDRWCDKHGIEPERDVRWVQRPEFQTEAPTCV